MVVVFFCMRVFVPPHLIICCIFWVIIFLTLIGCISQYDNLRSQAAVMKERYEERITELEERLAETSAAAATKGGDSQDVASEVCTPVSEREGILLVKDKR